MHIRVCATVHPYSSSRGTAATLLRQAHAPHSARPDRRRTTIFQFHLRGFDAPVHAPSGLPRITPVCRCGPQRRRRRRIPGMPGCCEGRCFHIQLGGGSFHQMQKLESRQAHPACTLRRHGGTYTQPHQLQGTHSCDSGTGNHQHRMCHSVHVPAHSTRTRSSLLVARTCSARVGVIW